MKSSQAVIVLSFFYVIAGFQSLCAQNDSMASKINATVSRLDSIISRVEATAAKIETLASALKDSADKNDDALPAIDSMVAKIRMNYAVPDAPAFKALGIQPDNVMRPSTTQEIAIILANKVLNSGLPSAFALELSPYLAIAGESLTLRQYQESWWKYFLYHLRVSVATERKAASGDTTKVSGGLRITLYDKSDLRLDKNYTSIIYTFNDTLVAIESRIKDSIRGPAPLFNSFPQKMKDSLNALAAQSIKIAVKAWEDSIRAYRTNAIKKNWNKPIVEFGTAIVGESSDSTSMNGITEEQAAGWLVAAGGISQWGQWVIGANGALIKNDGGKMSVYEGSFGARLYAGSNDAKVFIGIDWKGKTTAHPSYLFPLGSELKVYKALWISLSTGIEILSDGGSKLISNIDLRLGTP